MEAKRLANSVREHTYRQDCRHRKAIGSHPALTSLTTLHHPRTHRAQHHLSSQRVQQRLPAQHRRRVPPLHLVPHRLQHLQSGGPGRGGAGRVWQGVGQG